jgi:hypothetical protein
MTRHGAGLTALGLALLTLIGLVGPVPAQRTAPPGGAYRKVSELTALPEFLPGLGSLYVEPTRLPKGPYLGYDRQGRLVNTVYMIPLKDFQAHERFEAPEPATGLAVDHVDMLYNAGHPGLPEPHYEVILWYIPKTQANALR